MRWGAKGNSGFCCDWYLQNLFKEEEWTHVTKARDRAYPRPQSAKCRIWCCRCAWWLNMSCFQHSFKTVKTHVASLNVKLIIFWRNGADGQGRGGMSILFLADAKTWNFMLGHWGGKWNNICQLLCTNFCVQNTFLLLKIKIHEVDYWFMWIN